MITRFLHCADIHLGYQQYGRKERFNDFAHAFNAIVDKAIDGGDTRAARAVDFVILAGDLFHKRSIDALTLNQAVRALQRLRDKKIPCIAVEGNHERSYYEETIGWMKFLALQDLLILLDAEFVDGKPQLRPWEPRRRQGSYIDLQGGLRIHGLRYYGSGTALAVAEYAQAISEIDRTGVGYTIFVAHAGVEGNSTIRPAVSHTANGSHSTQGRLPGTGPFSQTIPIG
ncbi:MAG: metallophosphoesterase [Anaerolineales bacterium]|nr:metallophosphoesterase [Anaerolineales bacterium]